MKKISITPSQFRIILAVAMVILVAISVGVSFYSQSIIKNFASEVNESSIAATNSSTEIERLKNTKAILANRATTVAKTKQLVSDTKLYVYQDKIVYDLNQYARDAGVSIKSITFADTKEINTSANGTPTPPSTGSNASSQGTSSSAPAEASSASSVKTRTASIILNNPIDYYKLLNFIHSIEQGLFKMQISSVNLSKNSEGGVNTDTLTIEVYVR